MKVLYGMKDISINGAIVTCSNIGTFNLYKRFESEIADIYSSSEKAKNGPFIIHIKDAKSYAKDNEYLLRKGKYPIIDWFEGSLNESISYIKERL